MKREPSISPAKTTEPDSVQFEGRETHSLSALGCNTADIYSDLARELHERKRLLCWSRRRKFMACKRTSLSNSESCTDFRKRPHEKNSWSDYDSLVRNLVQWQPFTESLKDHHLINNFVIFWMFHRYNCNRGEGTILGIGFAVLFLAYISCNNFIQKIISFSQYKRYGAIEEDHQNKCAVIYFKY